MTRVRATTVVGGIAASVLLAVSAEPASAYTTVDIFECSGAALGKPPTCEPDISIDGDAGANTITISWNKHQTRFVVTERAAKIVAPDCKRLRPHAVRCPYSDEGYFSVDGGSGSDRISIEGVPPIPEPDSAMLGGPGGDVLIGTPIEDGIYGGMGPDVIRGRGGDDYMTGASGNFVNFQHASKDVLRGGQGDDKLGDLYDRGRDVSIGGPGDDKINGADGTRDASMNGGSGDDQCRVDPQIDPLPLLCENVFSHRWLP